MGIYQIINGKLCLTSSRKAKRCDCGVCPQCLSGTGVATSATATLDSVINGTGCIPVTRDTSGNLVSYGANAQANVDVTKPLSAVAFQDCLWDGTIAPATGVGGGGASALIWLNSGCTGIPPSSEGGCFIELTKIDGFWKLMVWGSIDNVVYAWFIGTIATPTAINCDEPLSFANDLTSLGAYNDPYFGWVNAIATGGTATVTF